MENKFIVIVTCYNKEGWVGFNINSIKQQSYKNYIAAYGYDKSTDNTLDDLEKYINTDDDRFIIYHNENPGSFLKNFLGTYNYLKAKGLVNPEDIIVEVDGDDWLLHPFVFQALNQIYQNKNIWMSYGQYIEYPSGKVGGHYYMDIDDNIDKTNTYRNSAFPYSHLKSYKAHLLDKVEEKDLIDPLTGKMFTQASDFALCMPMVEMAGKSRIYRVPDPIYVYNSSDEELHSESKLFLKEQKEAEARIRLLTPKERIK